MSKERDKAWRVMHGLEMVAAAATQQMRGAADAVALNGMNSNWHYLADDIERRANKALEAVAWCREAYVHLAEAKAAWSAAVEADDASRGVGA